MKVRDVMTHGVKCISPDATLQEAAQEMRDRDIGNLPVCGKNDRLVGMLTDRDIAIRGVAEGQDPWTAHVEDVMTKKITYCFEDQDVSEAAQIMQDNQIRRLPVLSRDKGLAGIVSLGDLAVKTGDTKLCGATLEEVSEPAFAHS